MRIVGFRADADLVGRRVRVTWEFVPDEREALADVPRVVIRRKTRDFDYPDAPADAADPFLVYDSAAFPPPGTIASDLPGWEEREGAARTTVTVESAAAVIADRPVEVTRHTTATTIGPDGVPLSRRVEVLDLGPVPIGLASGTTYYYQLFSPTIPDEADPAPYRATATATEAYGMGRALYDSLPEVYRRHDVTARPATPGAEPVPEAAPRSGQLRRFLDLFGTSLDLMRSSAEGLRDLRDVDNADHRHLALLARWIGWDLSFDGGIPLRRHEIKYAPALYRLTGTIPGCVIWVRRLTGWDCRVKEFYPNVLFSNDVGMADRTGDRGSRTVDTSDAELLARIGTVDDDLDYTYDTGTTDRDWYAYNVVGLFVRPPEDEPADDIARKRDKLRRSLPLFMPANVRGVVVVEAPPIAEAPIAEQFDFQASITEKEGS